MSDTVDRRHYAWLLERKPGIAMLTLEERTVQCRACNVDFVTRSRTAKRCPVCQAKRASKLSIRAAAKREAKRRAAREAKRLT